MPVVQRTNEYGNNSNSLAVPANSVTKQTSTSSIDSGASSATTSSSNSSQRSAILSINEEIKLKFQTNSLFRKQRQHPESGDSVNDDKLIRMANEKKLVKKGNYEGLLYDVDHLATFESNRGPISPEDGMRKLRAMERKGGLWPMKCQLMINTTSLIVFEKETNRAVEAIHVSKVCNPVSATSDNKKDTFNNVLLFTVLDESDTKKSSPAASSSSSAGIPNSTSSSTSNQTEMHIFQCVRANSNEIVDAIYQVVEQYKQQQRIEMERSTSRQRQPPSGSMPPPPVPSESKMTMNQTMQSMNNSFQQPSGIKFPSHSQSMVEREAVDQQVQILNHCFDDIEQFVSRLQNSLQYLRELERRRNKRNSPSSKRESGMLAMRAQLPPAEQFVDIFQKFKLSFNLLARLKTHIVDPNAPDLIRFLFTPLALIVNSTRDRPELKGIISSVWQPLLIADARELLLMCLGSKEQSLWRELGQAWNVTREEVYKKPDTYRSLLENLPPYVPTFYDDWSPSSNFNIQDLIDGVSSAPIDPMMNRSSRDIQQLNNSHRHPPSHSRHSDLSGLASSAVEQVNQSVKHSAPQQQVLPIERSRNYPNGQPVVPPHHQLDDMAHQSMNASYYSQHRPSMLNNSTMNRNMPPPAPPMPSVHQNHNNTLNMSMNGGYNPKANQSIMKTDMNASMNMSKIAASIPEYDEMKAWAMKLLYNGSLVYEITLGREGKNEKELTVRTGELIEVLDDKRNWWKVKSFYGRLGYVPSTIVRKYEMPVVSSQQYHQQPNGGHHHHQMPEKHEGILSDIETEVDRRKTSDDSDTTVVNEDDNAFGRVKSSSKLNISSSALSLNKEIKPMRTSSVILPDEHLNRVQDNSRRSDPAPDYSKIESELEPDYSMSVKSSTRSRRSSKSSRVSRASARVPNERIITSSPRVVSSNENNIEFQTQSALNQSLLAKEAHSRRPSSSKSLNRQVEASSRRSSSNSTTKESRSSSTSNSIPIKRVNASLTRGVNPNEVNTELQTSKSLNRSVQHETSRRRSELSTTSRSSSSSKSSRSKNSSPKYFESNVYLNEYSTQSVGRRDSSVPSERSSHLAYQPQHSRAKSLDRVVATESSSEHSSGSSTSTSDSELTSSRRASSSRHSSSLKPNAIPNLERIIGKTLLSRNSVEFKQNCFNFYPSYNAKPNRLRKKIPNYVLYPVVVPAPGVNTETRNHYFKDAETSMYLNIEPSEVVSSLNTSKLSIVEVKQNQAFYIDESSTPEDVRQFLVCHAYPRKIVRAFGGLNGQAIFTLTEEQLIKFAGRKYGSALAQQLKIQRSNSKLIDKEYRQSEDLARDIKKDLKNRKQEEIAKF